jgi:4-amino-4-deoxy-L-arabinose transferase-like glycosyltransferase
VLVFVLALLVRLDAATGQPPQPDDLYHFYAARSVLADGSFTVFSGTYLRAEEFTRLVAAAMGLFGESLAAARIPSLFAGALLVAAVHLWLRREAGRGVAAVASALLILLYPTVLVGTLVRFYALQALLFWVGTALLYRLVAEGRARLGSAVLAALALLLLAAAARLQVVTLIGLVGFAAWAALHLAWRMRHAVPLAWLVLGWAALLLLGGLAAFALAQSDLGARLLETYRSASLWAEQDRNNVLFYYYLLAQYYGVLGNYLPLAALAAFAFYPRPALYCTIVLGAGLLLHSFGGMKQDRYIAYLMPHFAALWAMAGWPLLRAVRDRLSGMLAPSWRLVPPLATAGLALLLAALLVKEVPMLDRSVRTVILPPDRPVALDIGRAWQANRARLLPLAQGAQVFVADDDLQAAFHVARADFFLNRSQLLENRPPVEFVRDFRTGTPLVSSPESLQAIIACFDRGLLVSSSIAMSWLTPEARQVIATRTRSLDLVPPLIGHEWNHEGRQGESGPECTRLRDMAAATAHQRAAR